MILTYSAANRRAPRKLGDPNTCRVSKIAAPMSDDEQRTYEVTGMSCEHCAAAVAAEVGELAGVSGVDVDLASGAIVVSGSDVDGEAVRVAVEAAGYGLAEQP
jgi:copper chaperone